MASSPGGLTPLKVAVLGAGGFVKDAYLLPLEANQGQLLVTALWSRSEESVSALLPDFQSFSPSCRSFHGDEGLQALLASPDVDAVLVVLPPQAQGAVVQAALRAGKHVLSEKPIAPTLAQAEQLLAFHQSLPQPAPLWCVAENYRSMDALLRLRDLIASGRLGATVRLDMAVDLALHPGGKYYDSSWRRDSASLPGAYLTEGGVHFVAALRMMAGAAGWGQATTAVAAARGISADLPHPDALLGMVWFESGAAASYSMATCAGGMHVALQAVGTAGAATAERGGAAGRSFRMVQLAEGQTAPTQSVSGSTGIEEELLCFARLACGAASAPGGVSLTLTAREAGAAAATDGSDPEPDAVKAAAGSAPAAEEAPAAAAEPAAPEPSVPAEAPQSAAVAPAPARPASPHIVESPGKSRLKDMPSDEDEWRVSCVEAARDLAVVAALLESAANGGQRTDVRQF